MHPDHRDCLWGKIEDHTQHREDIMLPKLSTGCNCYYLVIVDAELQVPNNGNQTKFCDNEDDWWLVYSRHDKRLIDHKVIIMRQINVWIFVLLMGESIEMRITLKNLMLNQLILQMRFDWRLVKNHCKKYLDLFLVGVVCLEDSV